MKMSIGQFLGMLLVLVAVVVGAVFGVTKLKGEDNGKARQAIFLTNGQVYFGYVNRTNNQWVTLKDIYYLQVQQPLQQGQNPNEQPQVSLVKLGNELHGPIDIMKINRDQILFYEDMKDDSKVNQAIADFIKKGASTTPSPAPSP